jgi:hypothetical protein
MDQVLQQQPDPTEAANDTVVVVATGTAKAVTTGETFAGDNVDSKEESWQLESPPPSSLATDPSTPELSTPDPSAGAMDFRADSSINRWSLQPKGLQLLETEERRVPSMGSQHKSVATVCRTDGGYCQYDSCPELL